MDNVVKCQNNCSEKIRFKVLKFINKSQKFDIFDKYLQKLYNINIQLFPRIIKTVVVLDVL